MNAIHLGRGVALALSLACVGGHAMADGKLYEKLLEMRAMDANKNGMVSKKEMMAMLEKAWDMKMKEMGMKEGQEMTEAQMREFLKSLYTGG